VRLKALARRICGDERPKQYVPILGNRLSETVAAQGSVPSRPLWLRCAAFRSSSSHGPVRSLPRVSSATDRGTAAGPLPDPLGRTPGSAAIVRSFLRIHFVRSRRPSWRSLRERRLSASTRPVGAPRCSPNRPGSSTAGSSSGSPLDSTMTADVGKSAGSGRRPSVERARLCLEAGCLWNTSSWWVRHHVPSAPPGDGFRSLRVPGPGSALLRYCAEAAGPGVCLDPKDRISRARDPRPCPLSWPWRRFRA